jgi:hypothetical protein
MATLTCRNVAKDCLDTLTAADSTEIQKVYLAHVHAKHQLQWNQFSRQFKAISIVTMRDRFLAQVASGETEAIPVAATPALPNVVAVPGSPA